MGKRRGNNQELRALVKDNGLTYGAVARKMGIRQSDLFKNEYHGTRRMLAEWAIYELLRERSEQEQQKD